ncbi:riboflavin kinase [Ectobacillus ponti]|uniref:riboflavin kinase n=1 Tax=Ectobacillus ponti TaxID=2961894 RepID=A0AA41XFC4_9BACI|nr:riboflavin kinase [Ectobacillus ponti]MCP8971071.1 riboflavin kinase [Ectobacillus ponti]
MIYTGIVVHGDKLGRTIGFPTANLELLTGDIAAKGVYAVLVQHGDRMYTGVMNIGRRPTVADDKQLSVEVHILDFHEHIYGHSLTVSVVGHIRPEQKFAGLAELQAQIARDVQSARYMVQEREMRRESV